MAYDNQAIDDKYKKNSRPEQLASPRQLIYRQKHKSSLLPNKSDPIWSVQHFLHSTETCRS